MVSPRCCCHLCADPELSERGRLFAKALGEYFASPALALDCSSLCVWTSCLKRSLQTAEHMQCGGSRVEWQSLREIEHGVCDGLTQKEIRRSFPAEFIAYQSDVLRYRYPRAENYLDVIARVEPLIFELERPQSPIVIIGHQAVMRCLYAYFLDVSQHEIPYLSIPLHTIIRLDPKAYGCSESRSKIVLQDA